MILNTGNLKFQCNMKVESSQIWRLAVLSFQILILKVNDKPSHYRSVMVVYIVYGI